MRAGRLQLAAVADVADRDLRHGVELRAGPVPLNGRLVPELELDDVLEAVGLEHQQLLPVLDLGPVDGARAVLLHHRREPLLELREQPDLDHQRPLAQARARAGVRRDGRRHKPLEHHLQLDDHPVLKRHELRHLGVEDARWAHAPRLLLARELARGCVHRQQHHRAGAHESGDWRRDALCGREAELLEEEAVPSARPRAVCTRLVHHAAKRVEKGELEHARARLEALLDVARPLARDQAAVLRSGELQRRQAAVHGAEQLGDGVGGGANDAVEQLEARRPSKRRHVPRLDHLQAVLGDRGGGGAPPAGQPDRVAKHVDRAHRHHQVSHHLGRPLRGGDGGQRAQAREDVVHLKGRDGEGGVRHGGQVGEHRQQNLEPVGHARKQALDHLKQLALGIGDKSGAHRHRRAQLQGRERDVLEVELAAGARDGAALGGLDGHRDAAVSQRAERRDEPPRAADGHHLPAGGRAVL
mmetsp:Transcript_30873/g.98505  ORF Transcript_30873/g.98505 Transcript_30873/m.98505 type:complete len:471 (+) Transcript_30873:1064-2476(+)